MATSQRDRLESLAKDLGVEDADDASDVIETYAPLLSSDSERYVVTEWAFSNLNFGEIAQILNLEAPDIKVLKKNAVANIRRLMQK